MIERIQVKSKHLAPYMPKVVWSNHDTILMTEITDCETIFDHFEREPSKTSSVASLIGQCVAELHNIGIIHGDLTTSNLLLVPKSRQCSDIYAPSKKIKPDEVNHVVIPIDFGLSTGSNHPEERAVDLYVLERALLSTHFSNSDFFSSVLDSYLHHIDEKTCEPSGKQKIIERLKEVRLRGRKSDYASGEEA